MSGRNSQRPDSRASTTSAVSHNNDAPSHTPFDTTSEQYMTQSGQAALLHYQPGAATHANPQYDTMVVQQSAQHLAQPAPYPMANAYGMQDSPYMQQDMAYANAPRFGSVPIQAVGEMADDKRRKGSAVTATNDRELREMLAKNEGRPLRDVAQEVIQKERTPMAEKTKQLFAMLWLRTVCKPAKTSVPRNRVYSQYATRCGTERVVPLNPASFGKLVRVIFPGIQTRRLGVRGESKYHYVDLALEEDNPNWAVPTSWQSFGLQQTNQHQRSQSVSTQQIDFSNIPRLQADMTVFPTNDGAFEPPLSNDLMPHGPASRAQRFAFPDTRGMQPGAPESLTYQHTLRFPSAHMSTLSENEPVDLPAIHPYLPHRTDSDTAEALAALYRTHCTSLIDSIRFCKEKQFFRLYTSFQGTLTVPVQKLFTHPNLAAWIEQCDLVMYRTMVRFVSRLTLQAAPVVVINILSNISANLHGHVAKTFAALPSHVMEAKLRPATMFAALLYRLIRVNQSAHAAANLLTIDQNREHMWHEWTTMVNPKRVMEAELPECGYEEVYTILTSDIRSLLEPLHAPAPPDDFSSFNAYGFDGDASEMTPFSQSRTAPQSSHGPSQVSTENVLDRWSTFVSSLPARFPNASARTILHCISAIGTAALRDITIMSGQSYGHWWVLKIFVDEMALWLAEMGGFLEPLGPSSGAVASSPSHGGRSSYNHSPVLENGNNNNNGGRHSHEGASRMSSMGPAGGASGAAAHDTPHQSLFAIGAQHHSHQQFPSQQHHGHPLSFLSQDGGRHKAQPPHKHDDSIDDSGIGMSLMDDDLNMSKYGLTGSMDGMNAAVQPL